jgi:hypothetical protein
MIRVNCACRVTICHVADIPAGTQQGEYDQQDAYRHGTEHGGEEWGEAVG